MMSVLRLGRLGRDSATARSVTASKNSLAVPDGVGEADLGQREGRVLGGRLLE